MATKKISKKTNNYSRFNKKLNVKKRLTKLRGGGNELYENTPPPIVPREINTNNISKNNLNNISKEIIRKRIIETKKRIASIKKQINNSNSNSNIENFKINLKKYQLYLAALTVRQ